MSKAFFLVEEFLLFDLQIPIFVDFVG